MGKWPAGKLLVERRLKQTSARLRSLRDDLRIIDDQLAQLADEADETSIRSLISETSAAAIESRRAREHADAMAGHRAHVIAKIGELERRQDSLLDRMHG